MKNNVTDILWSAACSGDIHTLKAFYEKNKENENNIVYNAFNKDHSLIMGAFRNDQFETVDYLLSIGETVTKEEYSEIEHEIKQRCMLYRIYCETNERI